MNSAAPPISVPARAAWKHDLTQEKRGIEGHFRLLFDTLFEAPELALTVTCYVCLALIALVDWQIKRNVSMGFAYSLVVVAIGCRASRLHILLFAVLAASLREFFSITAFQADYLQRIASFAAGYFGLGLFANEAANQRRRALALLREAREEARAREEAEQQLRMVLGSSPVAILTVDHSGIVETANSAAHQLLRIPEGHLAGQQIARYVPLLNEVVIGKDAVTSLRTATNCPARRENGEPFLACIWFSRYEASDGPRIAAFLTDASDDIRDMQESSLQSLMRSTRVLVGSVSHEIRNLCAGMSVIHANLGRIPGVAGTEDYEALGTLTQGLVHLMMVEIGPKTAEASSLELPSLIEELGIVIGPDLRDGSIDYSVDIQPGLTLAQADHHSMMQILLNLTRNSIRVLESNNGVRSLHIQVRQRGRDILVRIVDNGPGVADTARLFQPFQPGATSTGLGLFLSRAMARNFGGELYHEKTEQGCTMCLQLRVAESSNHYN